uniref:Uncharacterized protein n=1 Tax=uncultured Thiotrichaceae bacterium TaxID=298394 RepID=A0A6S6SWA6_9GAMM|nr:MAG: Unknown protein [uncultured Thiotrichaceae bacterium]
MKSYLAHDKCSGSVHGGSRTTCLRWAFNQIKINQGAVVNILLIRHKAPGRVIAEVDKDGGRWIFGGRAISITQVSKLLKRVHHG